MNAPTSKYRHLFTKTWRKEVAYTHVNAIKTFSSPSLDTSLLSGGAEHFALVQQTHNDIGKVAVNTLGASGNVSAQVWTAEHRTAVTALEWAPLERNTLAVGHVDGTVQVYTCEGAAAGGTLSARVALQGPSKVLSTAFHRVAGGALLAAYGNRTLKLWDVAAGKERITVKDVHAEIVQSMTYDHMGVHVATASRDKVLRVLDLRNARSVGEKVTMPCNASGAAVHWVGTRPQLLTLFTARDGKRQLALWDTRAMNTPLSLLDIGRSASAAFFHYDADNGIAYVCGKGESIVSVFDIGAADAKVAKVAEQRLPASQRAMCVLPKRVVDVREGEVARLLMLQSSADVVDTVQCMVPRSKKTLFHEDLFPPAFAGEPGLTLDEFMYGDERAPVRVSLQPTDVPSVFDTPADDGGKARPAGAPVVAPGATLKEPSKVERAEQARVAAAAKEQADAEAERKAAAEAAAAAEAKRKAAAAAEAKRKAETSAESGGESSEVQLRKAPAVTSAYTRASVRVRRSKGVSTSEEALAMEGWLSKRNPSFGWKRRWFVLKGDAVFYFEKPDAPSSNGSIRLDKVTTVAVSRKYANKTKNCCFEVVTPSRVYYLTAGHIVERDQWIRVLQLAMQRRRASMDSRASAGSRLSAATLSPAAAAATTAAGTPARSLSTVSTASAVSNAPVLPDLRGYMDKANPLWGVKRRFFWLEDETLMYAVKEGGDAVANIHLDVVLSVERGGNFGTDEENARAFHIDTPQRIYWLKCDTVDEREKWISGLTSALHELFEDITPAAAGAASAGAAAGEAQRDARSESMEEGSGEVAQPEGFLMEYSSGGFMSGWKKRYVRVKGNMILLMSNATASVPLQRIPLELVVDVGSIADGAGLSRRDVISCFQIVYKADHAEPIQYMRLLAESPADRERWVHALEHFRQQLFVMQNVADDVDGVGDGAGLDAIAEGDAADSAEGAAASAASAAAAAAAAEGPTGAAGSAAAPAVAAAPQGRKASLAKKKKRKQTVAVDLGVLGLSREDINLERKVELARGNVLDPAEVKRGKQPILVECKGKRWVRCRLVEVAASSLCSADVFVLDGGSTIYQWNGRHSNRFKAAKALDIATRIRFKERSGNATIVTIREGEPNEDVDESGFWALLGGTAADVRAADEAADDLAEEQAIDKHTRLYKVNKEAYKTLQPIPLADKRPSKDMLTTKGAYLLDCGAEIYVWTGKASLLEVRKLAMRIARLLLRQDTRPAWAYVCRVFEQGETELFKDKFSDYPSMLPISTGDAVHKSNVASRVAQVNIDVMELHEAEFPEEPVIDVEECTVKIWRIDGFERYPMPDELYGHFFSGDSFIVLFSYRYNNKDRNLIYFWQGRDSTISDRGTSALLTVELDDDQFHGEADQVRVEQNRESLHFVSLFKGKMVVHRGTLQEYAVDQTSTEHVPAPRLYHVRGDTRRSVRAVEVDARTSSLCSNNVYVAHAADRFVVWEGWAANDAERECANRVVEALQRGGLPVTWIAPGEPMDALLALVGGSADDVVQLPRERRAMKLFQCSIASGVFMVYPIANACQDDLDDEDVMIMDIYDSVYVWFGQRAAEEEKRRAMELAVDYVTAAPDGRPQAEHGGGIKTVYVVHSGCEPGAFQHQFHGWSMTKLPVVDDDERVQQPIEDVLAEYHRDVFSYDELLQDPLPKGVDPTRLETYLDDASFMDVFGMSRDEFAQVPSWKQGDLKKRVYLF